ncbi:MAG TPA: NTP transferase domain-containing protein [Syntrophomonadaceae bacterium]|nr:NTP transferase domain-containing protein [Syntrophomonadaceae bacterium]
MVYAVVMAGGSGQRFWPKSRQEMPKQFLSLVGEKTMLQRTVGRLKGFVNPDEIYIITAALYTGLVLQQVPEVPTENIITEPYGRDTAAAVGLAAITVAARDPEGVMIVLPADHFIADEERFRNVLKGAVAAAGEGEHLVTIGITPSRPETGFGYIARGSLHGTFAGIPAYVAEGFTEKPDLERARQYLASGNYFWNSGMFIWRADLIIRMIREYMPELYAGLQKIQAAMGSEQYQDVLNGVYSGLPKISIDYGVMEKATNVLVLPGSFGWDDVGSWTALEAYKVKDRQGNILEGKGVLVDTQNTLVFSSEKVVATLGVKDLIVVVGGDSVLVCHKKKAQEIKKVINALQEQGYQEIL